MPIGGIISGIGSLAGGLIGASGASSAASAQVKAEQNALNTQVGIDQVIQQQLAPWLSQGQNANYLLGNNYFGIQAPGWGPASAPFLTPLTAPVAQGGVGAPPSPQSMGTNWLRNIPGYQFERQQGINAINNSAAAQGVTGNTLRALANYGTGLAGQDYWNFYNATNNSWLQNYNAALQNRQNIVNWLSGMSGQGQNAATNQGALQTQLGANASQLMSNMGSAQAAGIIGSSNALSGAINSLSNNQSFQNSLAYLFSPSTGGAGNSGSYSGSIGALASEVSPNQNLIATFNP